MLQRTVSTSLNNLFALPEFDSLYEKFALFNYIRVRAGDETLKLRLIGIEFNGESASEIQVTFSEQIESVDGIADDLKSIIQQAGGMATSYPSTERQAKQGAEAEAEIESMYRDGLNAAKTMLSNNADNEVTITEHSGILCRRRDDEDSYGEKQLKITGNIMAFTDDDWKSVRMAIGETEFKDPTTGEKRNAYGIVAENIVGKLLAGEKAYIGNENGSVLITGDGIDVSNGSIFLENDNYSIEIDPQNRLQSDPDKKYLFCIRNKTDTTPVKNGDNTTDNSVIMGVKADGSGYFKGEMHASRGHIANFNILEDKLCTEEATFNNNIGIYFGNEGLRIGGGFKVNNKGNLTSSGTLNLANGNMTYDSVTGLTVKGNIQAKNGTFSGTITSSATIKGGTVSGSNIDGGKITIGDNFEVKPNGDVIAKSITLIGNVRLRAPGEGENSLPAKNSGITVKGPDYGSIINETGEKQDTHYILGYLPENHATVVGMPGMNPNFSPTKTVLRGNEVLLKSVFGSTVTSDERLKNSFKPLDEFESVYMDIKPCAFKYNNGSSGRYHFGVKAQNVKEAFEKHGYTMQDFGGFVQMADSSENDDYCGIDDPMGIIYTEFTMWNMQMIQGAIRRLENSEKRMLIWKNASKN